MSMLKDPVSNDDHVQGQQNAEITLVEYGDYQCPFCGHAYLIIKQIQEHFGLKLRFVFRNFPLTEIHPLAKPAAELTEYAGSEGKFWKMHDLIYESQANLSLERLVELADSLDLSSTKLKDGPNTFDQKIQKDFIGGVKSGVNGTPTLFINDDRYAGPVEFRYLILAINKTITS
ncbi:DsbA family protein [Parachlamydia acanthamoebae]|uniref:DsbA family protein n=1 Tax=Parachlamydia acanthamoebae TaxID=83552 RepID=UPI00075077AE